MLISSQVCEKEMFFLFAKNVYYAVLSSDIFYIVIDLKKSIVSEISQNTAKALLVSYFWVSTNSHKHTDSPCTEAVNTLVHFKQAVSIVLKITQL